MLVERETLVIYVEVAPDADLAIGRGVQASPRPFQDPPGRGCSRYVLSANMGWGDYEPIEADIVQEVPDPPEEKDPEMP